MARLTTQVLLLALTASLALSACGSAPVSLRVQGLVLNGSTVPVSCAAVGPGASLAVTVRDQAGEIIGHAWPGGQFCPRDWRRLAPGFAAQYPGAATVWMERFSLTLPRRTFYQFSIQGVPGRVLLSYRDLAREHFRVELIDPNA